VIFADAERSNARRRRPEPATSRARGPAFANAPAIGTLVVGATFAAFVSGRAFGGDVAQTMAFDCAALALVPLDVVELERAVAVRGRRESGLRR